MSDSCMKIEILERIHEFSVRGANGDLTEEDWVGFEQLLREDDDACRMYGQYVDVSTLLPAILSSLSSETASSTDVAFPEPLEPARSAALPLLGAFWHGTVGFFSQEIPFALLVATILTSVGLWAGSMVYVSHRGQLANGDLHSASSGVVPKRNIGQTDVAFVGRVTGMADVQWADINTSTECGNGVPLGRKYALASGLMEITYDTGAKVILQGPVTYEVDSRDGGFLSVGKLTAKLEKKGSEVSDQQSEKVAGGQWLVASETNAKSQITKSQIPNPQSLIPNPSFAVRTPTAVVTDLGTEFGVEVDKSGRTGTQVFVGVVKIAAISEQGNETAQSQTLHAGQYASVDTNRVVVTGECNFEKLGKRFVRTMPKPRDADLAYANLVLSMNPVVYYRMDQWPTVEGKNHYILVDSAPGGHNGVACLDPTFGKPSSAGKFGGALDLHGPMSADYAFAKNYPKAENGQISVSAWAWAITLDPFSSIVANWFYKPVPGQPESVGQFGFGLTSGLELIVGIQQQDGGIVFACESGKPLPRGQWQHVAFVADGAVLHLYRNGIEVDATPYRGIARPPLPECLSIGCQMHKDGTRPRSENAFVWNGRIDEIAVFNHALSAEQVRRLSTGRAAAAGRRTGP